jgi:hypothetical protein
MKKVVLNIPLAAFRTNQCRSAISVRPPSRNSTFLCSTHVTNNTHSSVMDRIFPAQDFASNDLNRSIAGRRDKNFIKDALKHAGTKILLVSGILLPFMP